MPTNALIREKSPYLLQHAHNPVDWYAWGEEAFRQAREREVPIFLSIGYSTCHWCHVMERESFENSEIATLLNREFVSIKVDREERPDVDRVYMAYVQATTGSGGWPMSVFLTPELKPIFGGTYFPPEQHYGQPGFRRVLEGVAEAWRRERAGILENSRDVLDRLGKATEVSFGAAPDSTLLDSGFYAFRRNFDAQLGGFGGAPKFPRPSVYNFLLRYWSRTGNSEARDMVLATLKAMARGGIHDHLGGGFHRYSVDERWHVPHFEKMLYDQAQLAIAYLEAFQVTHDEAFAATARDILDYVRRDMTNAAGGFYSAEDADSEGREGAFYVWTREEIESMLGSAAERFCRAYGVEATGNVLHDPHDEFRGRNVLYLASDGENFAMEKQRLLEARSQRPRPHLDDKILTSWNGLMISAFAKSAQVLDDAEYLEAARRAAAFVLDHLYSADHGALLRRYRDGDSAIPAFLDDYAFFAQGLLDLYEAGFDTRHLEVAARLTDSMIARFEDREHGGFYSTPEGDPSVLLRMRDNYDGAEPSGISIAVMNLFRLAEIAGRDAYRETADKALRSVTSFLGAAPSAAPQMLATLAYLLGRQRQIVLVGERDAADTHAFLRAIHSQFLPGTSLTLLDGDDSRRTFGAHSPAIAAMERLNGAATAYLCENRACQLPTTDPEGLLRSLMA